MITWRTAAASSRPAGRRPLAVLAFAFVASCGVHANDSAGLEEVRFTPRSGPRGATMFVTLSPEQTGVVTENSYADPSMWAEHYQEIVYGETGTGVCVGDYDNDGRPDLFVVSKTGQSRLFRNLGNWKFEDVTAKAGLVSAGNPAKHDEGWLKTLSGAPEATGQENMKAWQQGATFVDVNNDGWLDLYVCRFGAANQLFINQRDGTFKEEAAVRGLAVVDACGMAAFCDYDRDGWLDVYVQTSLLDAAAHPNGQRDHLFHNQGDGRFVEVSDRAGIAGESMGHSATWWDYDNDGWPDLYVTNDYAAPDHLYHNQRDGTFVDAINQVVPHQPYYAMGSDLGDINNDGLIDFFVADMAATTHEKDQRGMAYSRAQAQIPPKDSQTAAQLMHNELYLNTNTGRCLEVANLAGLAATDWTWSVRLEDLDNDGRLDLHVTNGMIREYHSADLLSRLMGMETLESRRIMRASPKLTERNLAFRNLGDLQFSDVSAEWGLDQRGVSFGAAFADFDGDGDLDLVYANYEAGVTLLRNDSDSGHSVIIALNGVQTNRFGAGAVVRVETAAGGQVRPLVLARGYLSSSEPVVHFGLGQDERIQRLTVEWPSGQKQVFTDLAVDRRFTITEPSEHAVPPVAADTIAPGQFTPVEPAPALSPASAEEGRSGGVVAVADFDHDGHLDRFVGGRAQPGRYSSIPRSALYANRGGELQDVTDSVAPGLREIGIVKAALWSDADGDGWVDLLVALDWGQVKYFHNREGRALEDWTDKMGFAGAGTGWWTSLATADFNGDGRPDYVAGNVGLNTQYRATPERPALLFFGKFGGTGGPFVVEGYYEGDRLYPRQTRKDLGAKIPSILKRFPRNDQYGRATLAEILGEDKLATAQRWAATELRSGVFLSQPDGRYRFTPLPRLAQVAPISAVAAGDFEGDGRADIYAVQNAPAHPPAIGRFDGGLSQLLRGDGRGNFAPVPPAESGLVVPEADVTGLAVLDFDGDGWPDFLISRSDGTPRAFRNRGVVGRHSLRVVVQGPADNPSAIGARVALDLNDGATQTAEAVANAINTGQAPAACFFGYADSNLPRRLRIRWPDGSSSTHEVPPHATTVTLTKSVN
jgi:hypothetical protein